MNGNNKVITSGLLPDVGLVKDFETVKMFSDLCEDTCSNLFAFSPYQLHIEREEFLHFQYLADELKSFVVDEGIKLETLRTLCKNLNSVYSGIMQGCWDAFVCNPDINGEPGKFIFQQQMTVDLFDRRVNAHVNSL